MSHERSIRCLVLATKVQITNIDNALITAVWHEIEVLYKIDSQHCQSPGNHSQTTNKASMAVNLWNNKPHFIWHPRNLNHETIPTEITLDLRACSYRAFSSKCKIRHNTKNYYFPLCSFLFVYSNRSMCNLYKDNFN